MAGHLQGALNERADELIRAGRALHRRGWLAAGSGSLSARLDMELFAITVSGADTGVLTEDDFLVVNAQGHAVQRVRTPSPEIPVHTMIYGLLPWVGAVLHIHSANATLASLTGDEQVSFQGYELLKTFRGVRSHLDVVNLPVLANEQNTPALASNAAARIQDTSGSVPGCLIRGNGLYAWGASVGDTMRHLEALELLLDCHLRLASPDGHL